MVWKIIFITSIVSEKSDFSESLHKILHKKNFFQTKFIYQNFVNYI